MLVKKAKPLCGRVHCAGVYLRFRLEGIPEVRNGLQHPVAKGLSESAKLEEPLFTPSTKAEMGEHDVNISFEEAQKIIGKELAEQVKDISIRIYKKAAEIASRGDNNSRHEVRVRDRRQREAYPD